jgi:EpsI family protein
MVSLLINGKREIFPTQKAMPLHSAFSDLPGWKYNGPIPLDSTLISWLKLDDYLNAQYSDGYTIVTLYIGYYKTIEKVGYTHSPLVCFPGQGWTLSDFGKRTLTVGNDQIHLMQIIASKQSNRVLLLYWYQAYDKTASGTFRQKINTLLSKVFAKREDNAFVRLIIPLDHIPLYQAIHAGERFISDMYPQWLKFLKADDHKAQF